MLIYIKINNIVIQSDLGDGAGYGPSNGRAPLSPLCDNGRLDDGSSKSSLTLRVQPSGSHGYRINNE